MFVPMSAFQSYTSTMCEWQLSIGTQASLYILDGCGIGEVIHGMVRYIFMLIFDLF